MAFNLMDSVKGLFGNELIGKASSLLGENQTNLQTAVTGIIPSVLIGLINKAGSVDPHSILSMAKDASQSGILSNFGGLLSNNSLLGKGADMVKSLFGEKTGSVNSMISNFSGVRESSASSLMSMAAPAVLGVLGKHATDTDMSAGSMLSFLNSQKDKIIQALPAGLNLAGALGVGSLFSIGSKLSGKLSEFGGTVSSGAKNVARTAQKTASGGRRWLSFILLAIAVILLFLFLWKGCNSPDK